MAIEIRLGAVPNLYSLKQEALLNGKEVWETLVLGACDAQAALIPSQFSRPGFNLAFDSQSYAVSAQLFARWAKEMPRLKRVLLSSSYFVWHSSLREGPEYWRKYFFSRFLGVRGELGWNRLFDIRRVSLFFLYWPLSQGLVFGRSIDSAFLYRPLENERFPLLRNLSPDGFLPFSQRPTREFTEEHAHALFHGAHRSLYAFDATENFRSVHTLLEQAQSRGIEVVFVRTPLHPLYLLERSEILENRERKFLKNFQKVFKIRVFDFRQDPAMDQTDFADLLHLNSAGATKFSKQINALL